MSGVTSKQFPNWELVSSTEKNRYMYRCLIGTLSDGREISCLLKTDGYLNCTGFYCVDGVKPKMVISADDAINLGDMECIKAMLLYRSKSQLQDTIAELQRLVANMNARLSMSGIDRVIA